MVTAYGDCLGSLDGIVNSQVDGDRAVAIGNRGVAVGDGLRCGVSLTFPFKLSAHRGVNDYIERFVDLKVHGDYAVTAVDGLQGVGIVAALCVSPSVPFVC